MRLIDADALMKVIREHDYPLRSHFNSTDNGMFTIGIQQAVDEAPTIDAVPVVHGRWKTWEEQFPDKTTRKKNNLGVFCSACQLHADNMTNYCPNCGAKMDKGANNG